MKWFLSEFAGVQGGLALAVDLYPVGSYQHANSPVEGVYQVAAYDDLGKGRIRILGKLILRTSFGYPDDVFRGYLICEVLNGRRSFVRSDEGWNLR